jgi:hypothetical protein
MSSDIKNTVDKPRHYSNESSDLVRKVRSAIIQPGSNMDSIECFNAMISCLDIDEIRGYLRGNVFKYQWRYKVKNGIEDLEKALWYLNKLILLEKACGE